MSWLWAAALTALLIAPHSAHAQSTYFWRVEAPGGNWQDSSGTQWWQSGGGATGFNFGLLWWDNTDDLIQTNNTTDASTFGFHFASGASQALTFTGSSVRFFDSGGTDPYIRNASGATHLINMNVGLDGDAADAFTIYIDGAGGLTFNGTINNQPSGAGSTINVLGTTASATTVTFNGAISGAGGFYKENANTTALMTAANTYSGQTTIQNGVLRLAGSGSLASSAVRLHSGATLSISNSATVSSVAEFGSANSGVIAISNGATLTVTANSTNIYQNSISGAGGLTKQGSHTLNLFGTQSYSGTTTVSAGKLSTSVALSSGGFSLTGGTFETTAANLISDTATVTLGGGTFSIGGAETFGNNGVTLTAATTSTVSPTNGVTATVTGALTGSGNLTKGDTGTLILSGNSTGFSGNTTVSAGTLLIGNANALGASGTVSVTTGARLQLSNGISVARSLTLNGDGISTSGALQNVNGNNTWSGGISNNSSARINSDTGLLTIAGNITNASTSLYIGGAGNTTIDGTITGSLPTGNGALFKNDAGTLTLSANNSALTGLIRLQGGTISVTNANSLGSGDLELGSGATTATLLVNANTTHSAKLAIADSSTAGVVNVATNTIFTQSGQLIQTNGTTNTTKFGKAGAGTLILNGGGSAYNGQVQIGDGTVIVGVNSSLSTNVTTTARGVDLGLNVGDVNQANNVALLLSNGVTLSNSIYVAGNTNSATRTIGISGAGTNTFNNEIYLDGTLRIDAGANATDQVTISGNIVTNVTGGGGGLIKTNTGILVLSGSANTFNGGVTLGAGTLRVGGNNVLGTGTLTINGGTFASDSASARTLTNSITMGGNVTFGDATGTGALTFSNISLGGGSRTFTVGNSTTIAGVISNGSGNRTLTKNGAGTLTLSGTNTYSGGTTVSAGTLVINGANTSAGTIDVSGSGTVLKLGNTNALTNGVLVGSGGSGTIATVELAVGGNYVLNSYGSSANAGGNMAFTNSSGSAATLTFTNATNYVTLSSTNNSGRYLTNHSTNLSLVLNGAVDIGSSANNDVAFGAIGNIVINGSIFNTNIGLRTVTKNGTGTLTLAASNSYNGGTTINAGTVAISNSSSFGSSAVTFASNGTTVLALSGVQVTNNYNLAANGTMDVGAFVLTNSGVISNTGSLTKAGAGTLILGAANTYTGGTTINAGTMAISNGSSFGSNAVTFASNGTTVLALAGVQVTNNYNLIANGTMDVGAFVLTNSGVISNSGSLTKAGAGTLVLSGANTYSGGTLISTGVLQVGAGAGNGSLGTGNITNNGGLIINRTGTIAINDAISGTAGLTNSGAGTLTLSVANSYDGATTVNAGALTISNGSALGSTTNGTTVAAGAALQLQGGITINGETLSLSGTNGDTASLRNISGANTYNGAITFANGTNRIDSDAGTLTLSSFASTVVSNRWLLVGGAGNTIFTGRVTGNNSGSLVKDGAGTLTLANTNNEVGPQGVVLINNGTLALGTNNALAANRAVAVNGGTLDIGGYDNTVGAVTLTNGTITNGTLSGTSYAVENGTISAILGGSGVLTKSAAGTVTLSGANTYSGGTLVSAGVLSGDTTSLQGTITNTAAVVFNQSTNGTYASVLSGAGTLLKTNAGTLTLTGANTQSGGTTIGQGTLQIGNGGSTGSLAGNITNNGTLAYNLTGTSTQSTVVSGSGTVTKAGSGTVTLGNAANTYGGTTTVGGGVLSVGTLANAGANSSIGTNGTIILTNGGVLDYSGVTVSIDRGISLASGNGGIGVSNSAAALTISGVISNTGTLVKSGAGTLVLSGANTYSGGTLVSAGTLQGDSSGVQGSITNNSLVLFTNAGTGTYSGIMSGSGGLTLNGVGSLTLSGNNTYSGNTTIAAGTLVMNGVNTGAGIVTVTNFSVLRLGQTNALTNGVLVGTTSATNSGSVDLAVGGDHSIASYGSVGNGGGNMNFTNSSGSVATLTFTAATNVVTLGNNGGRGITNSSTNLTLIFSGAVDIGSSGNNDVTFSGAGNTVVNGAIFNTNTGSRALTKNGTGTLTLTASNTYNGGTTISGGTLQVGDGGTTGSLGTNNVTNNATLAYNRSDSFSVSNVMSGTGVLTKSGAGTLTLSGANTYSGGTLVSAGGLAGSTTSLQGNITNNAAVTFDQSTNGTYGSVISGTGSLVKTNTGVLTLTNANTYTGGTLISGGALSIGNGGATGSLLGDITNNGGLVVNRTGALSLTGAITGTGVLTNAGAGTLTLSGANTYSGGTLVSAGVLAGDTTSLQGNITNNATTTFSQTTNGTYAGTMTGSGALTKSGAGTVTLTAANSYDGATAVSAGALTVSNGSALGSATGGTTVAAGAALQLQGGITVNGEALGLSGTNGDTASLRNISGNNTYNGTITFTTGTNRINSDAGTLVLSSFATGNALTSGRSLFVGGAGDTIFTGTLTGSSTATITKDGNGILTLSNTWVTTSTNGATVVADGTLRLGINQAITNNVRVTGSGATLDLGSYDTAVSAVTLSNGTITGTTGVLSGTSYAVENGTISAILGGSGALTKTAAGTVTLSGANTYSGATTISNGTLALSGASGALATATTVAISNGATFDVGGRSQEIAGLTGAGNATNSSGTLTVNNTANGTFSGVLSGAGALTKIGAATMTLAGNNTYTGTTTVSAGVLSLGAASGTTIAGDILINGGTLSYGTSVNDQIATTANATISSGSFVVAARSQTLASLLSTGGNVSAGSGLLTVTGLTTNIGGTLTSTNASTGNGYRFDGGLVTGNGASFVFNNASDGASGGVMRLSNSLTFASTNTSGIVFTNASTGIGVLNLRGAVTFDVADAAAVANEVNIDFNVGASGSLVKTNTGVLTLTASNAFTGGLTLGQGTLRLGNDNGLGTGSVTLGTGTIASTGTGARTFTNSLTIAGDTTFGDAVGTNSLTFSSTATNALGGTNRTLTTAVDTTIAGALGNGSITKAGNATLYLNNTNSSFSTLTINAGSVAFQTNARITGLAGSGNGALNLAGGTLTLSNAANSSFGQVISGPGGLTKSGSGTLTLSASNSYSGATTISGGRLALSGTNTSSAILVTNTGTLSGTGRAGDVVVASGGLIAPGNSPGNLTVGNFEMAGGGGYQWELTNVAGTPGTEWDLISITGSTTISATSGNKFTIYITGSGVTGWDANANSSWVIMDWGGGTGPVSFDENVFALNYVNFADTVSGIFSLSTNSTSLLLTYTGASGTPTYSGTNGVWSTGFTPAIANSANAIFDGGGGTATNNIASATLSTIGTVTFSTNASGSYTLTADSGSSGFDTNSALTVAGNIANESSYAQTVNLAMSIASAMTVDASNNITLGGGIIGLGSIVKTGDSLLALSGNNSYTGSTTISNGTVRLGSATALGATNGGTTVVSGATLDLNGQTVGTEALSIAGTGVGGNGALLNGSTNAASLAGAVTLTNATTINTTNAAGNITLSGAVSGAGSLTKTGTGTLFLIASNSYAGGTSLNAGTLAISNNNSLGSGTLTIGDGTRVAAFTTARTLSNAVVVNGNFSVGGFSATTTFAGGVDLGGATRTISYNNSTVFNGAISNGGLVVNGDSASRTFTLGASNTFTGGVTVNGGTLRFNGSGALVSTSAVVLVGSTVNASLDITNITASSFTIGSLASTNPNSTATLGAKNLIVGGNNATTTYEGDLTGTGGSLTKNGTGTMTLGKASTYTGGTTLNAGGLALGSSSALGTGTLTINGGAVGSVTSQRTLANNVAAGGNFTLGVGDQATTFSGTFDLGGATRTITLENSATLNGIVSNGGVILNNGSSGSIRSLTLGTNNTFSGGITVNGGTLKLSGSGSIASNRVDLTGSGTNATLDITNVTTSTTIGSLAGTNALSSVVLGSKTLDAGGDNTSTSFAGVISGSGNIAKSGTGTMTLTGANTYSGTTLISGGVLQVGNGGATGELGSGNITNNTSLVVNRSGSVAMGNTISGAGSLTMIGAGTLTLSANNSFSGGISVTAGGLSVSAANQLGATNNALTLNGGTLRSTATFDLGTGRIVTIGSGGGTFLTDAGTQLNFDGTITNTSTNSTLTKLGSGTLAIGAGSGVFTGNTTVGQGVLLLTTNTALANSFVTISNGAVLTNNFTGSTIEISDLQGSGTVDAGSNSVTVGSGNNNTTFSGALNISGSNNFTSEGTGTLTLSGKVGDTQTGSTVIAAGALQLSGSDNRLSTNAALAVSNGAVLNLNGVGQRVAGLSGTGTITNSGGATNLTVDIASGANTFSGTMQGAVDFAKTGAGTMVLAGNNGFTGAVNVLGGTLSVGADNNFGNAANTVTLSNNSAAVNFSSSFSSSRNFTVASGTTGTLLAGSGVTTTLGGSLSKNGSVLVFGGGGSFVVNGVISGASANSDLVVSNSTVTLNSQNTYSGPTYVHSSGVLNLGTNNAMPTDTDLYLGTNATSGTVNLQSNNQTVASLSTQGSAGTNNVVSLGSGTLTVTGSTSTTYNGLISGTGSLVKSGTSTLALTAANTYSGATTISNGTLQVSLIADGGVASGIGAGSTVTMAGANATNAVLDYTGGNVATDRTFVMNDGGGTINMASSSNTMTMTGSASGTGKLIVGEGTLVLSNGSTANSFVPGSIQVDSGATLQLAANDQIGNSTGLILNGGTFRTGTSTTGFSDTLGTLTLSASSTIDLGAWTTGVRQLVFANSSAITWTGTLTITNWQGVALQSSDVAEILFGTGGLTSTQLDQISFASQNISGGTLIGGGGELVPIPEPRVYAAAVALLAVVGWRERKRLLGLIGRKQSGSSANS